MIDQRTVQAVKLQLFSGQGQTVFAILDGASVPDLPVHLAQFNPPHVCLYRGELEPDMAAVAPYLALLGRDAPFTDWVLSNGWGAHWGIFGTAHADLPALRRHFRSFVIVYDDTGRSLYFRFYDPRVWRACLPVCEADELASYFGPVTSYLVEGDEGTFAFKYAMHAGNLQQDRLSVGPSPGASTP